MPTVTFDYSTAQGVYSIGADDQLFQTRWSQRGGTSIYASSNPPTVETIALAAHVTEIGQLREASRFNFEAGHCAVERGQIILLRNNHGCYAAIKVLDVKSTSHGGIANEAVLRYEILPRGGVDFSIISDIDIGADTFGKRVLLLGAGFSRNWGGYLAREVRERIFEHPEVQKHPALKKLVLDESSFEDAVEKSQTGLVTGEEARALATAVAATFDLMDEHYKNPNPAVLGATINDFLGRFCVGPVGVGTGYVFSLNQDLLPERIYGTVVSRQKLVIPGVMWNGRAPEFPAGAGSIPTATVPDAKTWIEPRLANSFNLVKLHGSINWRGADNASLLVIGTRKSIAISKHPLLEWQYRVFERVLRAGDVRIMVIGYGWADAHINRTIAMAVLETGLKVYNWNPTDPKDVLSNIPYGTEILSGLIGFNTRRLVEVMPADPTNPGSPDYTRIVETFF